MYSELSLKVDAGPTEVNQPFPVVRTSMIRGLSWGATASATINAFVQLVSAGLLQQTLVFFEIQRMNGLFRY